MIKGSCLCGGVRYEYDGEIDEISICHCSQCRKAQGSAFAAVSPVATERFRILAGAELLRDCLLYTSPSPRDRTRSRMPSSA